MKHKMRRFVSGGPTDYAESGSAGGTNISFGDAFKAARKQGLGTFTWRGKKYTTDTKEEKADKTLDDEVEVKSKRPNFTEIYKRDTVTDKTGMGQRGPSGRGGKRNLNVDQKIGESIRATSAGFDKKYKDEGSVFSRLARGAGFRKGGSVKSSASKRADGIAVRGKTRGKMV
jgi:hypothetical protein